MGKNKRQRVANGDKCFFSVYLLLETNNLETETKPKYPYDCNRLNAGETFPLFDLLV